MPASPVEKHSDKRGLRLFSIHHGVVSPHRFSPPIDTSSSRHSVHVDPWGNQYRIAIGADEDNKINLPYTDFQEPKAPPVGVAVFSFGKDGALGKNGDGIYRNNGTASDDILSWQ